MLDAPNILSERVKMFFTQIDPYKSYESTWSVWVIDDPYKSYGSTWSVLFINHSHPHTHQQCLPRLSSTSNQLP